MWGNRKGALEKKDGPSTSKHETSQKTGRGRGRLCLIMANLKGGRKKHIFLENKKDKKYETRDGGRKVQS